MDWPLLCVLHAVPTLCMTGLIWFVQVVHYPLFAAVGGAQFVAYEREHCRRTGRVVMPLMLAELGLAGWLWWAAPATASTATTLGVGLLAVVWVSTFRFQVPCHQQLSRRPDADTMQRLVVSNWLRTAAWTGRAGIAVWLLLA
ncbi:MAG: hypothetical protein JNM25_17215 [Planctomycetes bacterium]|nr:hypothetical protein [Planctomycetota bacterium]